jgi:hypothetical protein
MRLASHLFVFAICIGTTWNYVVANDLNLTTKATNDMGSFKVPAGSCDIRVETSSLGGFPILSLPSKTEKRHRVDDVNSYAFTATGVLLYSVNPIYGVPGIYLFNCASRKVRRLVSPKHLDNAYPRGADYFELVGVSGTKVLFYYAPDIDSVDVKVVRNPNSLYETDFDGKPFGKVN